MPEQIKHTSEYLKNKYDFEPEIGIILGTGLGNLVKEIETVHAVPYHEIPNFPVSTVEGHAGTLILGYLSGKRVVAMQGRFHYYEGYNMQQVTFPVRVMKMIGIHTLILSNASGGLNPEFNIGDLMIINDHINHFGTNPLIGKNIDEFGPRFPDMSKAYDKDLVNQAFNIAKLHNLHAHKGVYVGTSGPTFETPAEYKFFRVIGGDAVGMSTVPEVIVARHMGLKCFAISIITDMGVAEEIVEVSHTDVQDVARNAEPKMTLLIRELIKTIK